MELPWVDDVLLVASLGASVLGVNRTPVQMIASVVILPRIFCIAETRGITINFRFSDERTSSKIQFLLYWIVRVLAVRSGGCLLPFF